MGGVGAFFPCVPWVTFAPSQWVTATSWQVLRMAQFELQGGLLLENGPKRGTALNEKN